MDARRAVREMTIPQLEKLHADMKQLVDNKEWFNDRDKENCLLYLSVCEDELDWRKTKRRSVAPSAL